MNVFMIRRKSDGLYSKGGSSPSFSKNGKVWLQRGYVTSHMSQLTRFGKERYDDCEVIEFSLEPTGNDVPALEWKELPSTARARELEKKRQLEYKKEILENEKKELQRRIKEIDEKL